MSEDAILKLIGLVSIALLIGMGVYDIGRAFREELRALRRAGGVIYRRS